MRSEEEKRSEVKSLKNFDKKKLEKMNQLLLDLHNMVGSTNSPSTLQDRIDKFKSVYNNPLNLNLFTNASVHSQFCLLILECLKRISIEIKEYKTDSDSPFGLKDEKTLSMALSVICTLGILPHLSFPLLPSPLFSKLQLPKQDFEMHQDRSPNASILRVICDDLLDILKVKNPLFTFPSDFIIRHHLITLYAALLHLSDTQDSQDSQEQYSNVMKRLLEKE